MSWKLLNELWSLPWRDSARDAWNFAFTGVKFLCCLHVLDSHVCGVGLPVGPSMLPTFNLSGDILLVERFSPKFGKIKHGDIVIVTSPEDPKKDVIKRVTGMEGDCVESFRMENREENQCVDVPKGHVWLLGDNLTVSNDSRKYGPVPYAHIRGRVFLRIWPIGSFGVPK